jgi:hypothetical protein
MKITIPVNIDNVLSRWKEKHQMTSDKLESDIDIDSNLENEIDQLSDIHRRILRDLYIVADWCRLEMNKSHLDVSKRSFYDELSQLVGASSKNLGNIIINISIANQDIFNLLTTTMKFEIDCKDHEQFLNYPMNIKLGISDYLIIIHKQKRNAVVTYIYSYYHTLNNLFTDLQSTMTKHINPTRSDNAMYG